MNEVYIVTNGTFSDYKIIGVFTDPKLAEETRDKQKTIRDDDCKIETWPLNKEKTVLHFWTAFIDPTTGEIKEGQRTMRDSDWELINCLGKFRTQYTEISDVKNDIFEGAIFESRDKIYLGRSIGVFSQKSQLHANKLAVEVRQELLRLADLYRYRIKEEGNRNAGINSYYNYYNYYLVPFENCED